MKNLLCFVAGAAIGSVVTWKLIEKKYKDLADEEIESVIETFKNRKPRITKDEVKETVEKVINKCKEPKETVEDIVTSEGYSIENEEEIDEDDESNYTVDVDPGVEVIVPYVITPEQFGEYNEYGTKTLTYYADNVLTDEIDNPITSDEMETMIGPDALDHFGEYEDDSVYIRDEMNEMDYEILKSEKTFSEIQERGRAN
jgi:hypothetical protein